MARKPLIAIGVLVLLLLGLRVSSRVFGPTPVGDGGVTDVRVHRGEGPAGPPAGTDAVPGDRGGSGDGPTTDDAPPTPRDDAGAPADRTDPGVARGTAAGRAVPDGVSVGVAAGVPEDSTVIEGRVVDESSGRGIAGVGIAIEGRAGGPTATTDDDGAFRLGPLPDGSHVLVTSAIGTPWMPARLAGVGTGSTDVVIRLQRGLVITGSVVDDSGSPHPDEVRLEARPSSGSGDSRRGARGRTRPDGSFVLGPLAPGVYDLEAMPWPPVGTSLLPGTLAGIAAGATGVVVRLKRGIAFRGIVVDEEGRPVPHGIVAATWIMVGGGEETRQTSTFDDGTFTTFPLDPDRADDLRVRGRDGGSAILRGIRPSEHPLRIVLVRPSGTIRGIVVDEDGRPLGAGVNVSAHATGVPRGEPGGEGRARTDGTGAFVVGGLGDHTFRLQLMDGGVVSSAVPGEFRPGGEPIRLVARVGLVVSGRVLDAERRAIEHGQALISGERFAQSRPLSRDGRFRLDGLAPGRVTIRIRVGERTVSMGSWDLPAEDLELVLPAE